MVVQLWQDYNLLSEYYYTADLNLFKHKYNYRYNHIYTFYYTFILSNFYISYNNYICTYIQSL